MKKYIFLIFVSLILILHWIFSPVYLTDKIEVTPLEKIDSTVTVSFSSVGDIMCHSTQFNYARVGKDSFDFKPMFNEIGEYLRGKDILFGNLETVLAGETKRYSGYPFFNTPNELAEALKFAGFDFLFTTNNHSNDKGQQGVDRTIDILKKVNIVPIGTEKLNSSDPTYNIFVRKGLRFGVLAYTYGTNYNENAKHPRKYVNYINPKKIKNDIEKLKEKKADLIIVYFHFGKEYQREPTKYQTKIVDKTISYGADIILASHPHIVQKFEIFKTANAKLDAGFVTYSLGNFVSNQRWRYSDGGLIFNFDITKNIYTDSVYISDVNFLPIWVYKGKVNGKKEYVILPSGNYKDSTKYRYTTKADIDSMKKSYFDTIELFTEGNDYPRIDKLMLIE
ncbi:MAG: CapA family protein [Melioribacteraceae bacterium]